MNNTSTHTMPVCIIESLDYNTFIITNITAFVNVCTTSLTITLTMAKVHNKLHYFPWSLTHVLYVEGE